jgi:regulatory protein
MPGARRVPKKLGPEELFQYALKALGARGMATGELRVRLSRRAAEAGDVDQVLRRLKECGLLDDRRFAESFAASRLENEGLGSQRVLRDLRQRRVAPALAEKVVRDTYQPTDEIALIEDYLARKFRKVNLAEQLQDPARLAAAWRKLRYAGFSAGNSIRVLKRYSERAGELDQLDEPEPSDS